MGQDPRADVDALSDVERQRAVALKDVNTGTTGQSSQAGGVDLVGHFQVSTNDLALGAARADQTGPAKNDAIWVPVWWIISAEN